MKKKIVFFASLSLLCIAITWFNFKKITKPQSCPFCDSEILKRQVFYRLPKAAGILTHKPAVPGHVLIIPERHVERFEDLTQEEIIAISQAIHWVGIALKNSFGVQDYLLIQKNGTQAGQSVPHVHFHYLPAKNFLAARFLLSPWLKAVPAEDLAQLRENLAAEFAAPN